MEREFAIHQVEDYDVVRRTRYAVQRISFETDNKLKDVVALLDRRLGRQDAPPLLWDEMKRLIEDAIENPAVRRAELAVKYHEARVKDNQSVLTFQRYMMDLESRMDYVIEDGRAKVDVYFARLPKAIRDKIIAANTLKDCAVVDDLMAEATRHESTTKNSTGRTRSGQDPPPPRRESGSAADGARTNRGRGRGHRGGTPRRGGSPASGANSLPRREGRPYASSDSQSEKQAP
jgi:hypothetical protein